MNCKKCPVCQVFIDNDVVKFSYGKPGTRDRLYARVCQYTDNPNCINKNYQAKPAKNDYYLDLPPLKFVPDSIAHDNSQSIVKNRITS